MLPANVEALQARLVDIGQLVAAAEAELGRSVAEGQTLEVKRLEDHLDSLASEHRRVSFGLKAAEDQAAKAAAESAEAARVAAVKAVRRDHDRSRSLVLEADRTFQAHKQALDALSAHREVMMPHADVADVGYWRVNEWVYECRENLLQGNVDLRFLFLNSASNECSKTAEPLANTYPAFDSIVRRV